MNQYYYAPGIAKHTNQTTDPFLKEVDGVRRLFERGNQLPNVKVAIEARNRSPV